MSPDLSKFGSPPWKLNLGCGLDHLVGCINVDKEPKAKADLQFDIEQPWPIPSQSVSWIQAKHVIEHLRDLDVFFREAYRVMLPDSILEVTVPHPRSDTFLGDPTHVRPIIRQTLDLLSRRNCDDWAAKGYSNTPLAIYWDVDFECISQEFAIHDAWKDKFKDIDEALDAIATYNNVAAEIKFQLKRIKEAA
jgi:hypothetical protein